MEQFFRNPVACLTLAYYSTSNTGERTSGLRMVQLDHTDNFARYILMMLHFTLPGQLARRYIKDAELLRFIDLECFIWSTVSADLTPLINRSGLHDTIKSLPPPIYYWNLKTSPL